MIFVITCSFNVSQTLIDCAFKSRSIAENYVSDLNGDKTKAVARCKELIALREGEAAIKFLDEEISIVFKILSVELK